MGTLNCRIEGGFIKAPPQPCFKLWRGIKLIYGHGGQGAVTAANVLTLAVFHEGKNRPFFLWCYLAFFDANTNKVDVAFSISK